MLRLRFLLHRLLDWGGNPRKQGKTGERRVAGKILGHLDAFGQIPVSNRHNGAVPDHVFLLFRSALGIQHAEADHIPFLHLEIGVHFAVFKECRQ